MSDETPSKQELLMELMNTQADLGYIKACLVDDRPLAALRAVDERYNDLEDNYSDHYPSLPDNDDTNSP